MTRSEQQKRSVGRPRRIQREQIVDIARRILQEEGVDALSMRRVAKEVGATPMALYHHVRDKDELLLLTLDGFAHTLQRPDLPEDPRERVIATALHMHTMITELPWLLDVLGVGDLTDKGALWVLEEIINSAVACGLTPEAAVHTYRTIWFYLYGALVFRRAEARRAGDPDHPPFFPDFLTEEDAAELPRLTAAAPDWQEMMDSYDIAGQLRAVVGGLLPT